MVAVPVLLLVGGNIVFSSQAVSSVERIPYAMGQTQAIAAYYGGAVVAPQVDPWAPYYGGGAPKDGRGKPLPRWGTDPIAHAQAPGAPGGAAGVPLAPGKGFPVLRRRPVGGVCFTPLRSPQSLR